MLSHYHCHEIGQSCPNYHSLGESGCLPQLIVQTNDQKYNFEDPHGAACGIAQRTGQPDGDVNEDCVW